jgi:DNA-binding YbaB/EbfC family protein
MAKKIKAKGTSRNKAPGGAGGNQAAMMAQFQKMQQDMMQAQQELESETVDITVGGGAITVTITGHQRIEAIAINRDSIDLEDDEWLEDLQDLLVAAWMGCCRVDWAVCSDNIWATF